MKDKRIYWESRLVIGIMCIWLGWCVWKLTGVLG